MGEDRWGGDELNNELPVSKAEQRLGAVFAQMIVGERFGCVQL